MGAHRSEGRRDWLQQDVADQHNPWNIMIKHRHVQRRGRRSQMTVSYTDPVISMDLLRTVLQPSFNEDILAVFRKYMKFFEKAASNVKENVGEEVQADQLIREVCRNCLEQAKQLFSDGEKTTSRPVFEPPVKIMSGGDHACRVFAVGTFTEQRSAKKQQKKRKCCCRRRRAPRNTEYLVQVCWELSESKNVDWPGFPEDWRARHMEDDSSQRGSPVPRKRKGRPPGPVISCDRPVSFGNPPKPKTSEPIKREGPKWDPSRLNEKTTFVLGSRANKALGMGGTRGRIYIKHADLFKYAADAQDKHWLAEKQHMRATGGKMAYLLIEEDVQDLARSEDYRDCPELRLDELKPFMVPPWMIEKMQKAMEAQRSEKE